MRPIQISDLSSEQLGTLEELYRTTRDVRLRTRAQIILLAAQNSTSPLQRSPQSSVVVKRQYVAGLRDISPKEE